MTSLLGLSPVFPGYFLTLKEIGFSDNVTFLVKSSVLCIMDIIMLGSSLSSAGIRELVTLNECGRVACAHVPCVKAEMSSHSGQTWRLFEADISCSVPPSLSLLSFHSDPQALTPVCRDHSGLVVRGSCRTAGSSFGLVSITQDRCCHFLAFQRAFLHITSLMTLQAFKTKADTGFRIWIFDCPITLPPVEKEIFDAVYTDCHL